MINLPIEFLIFYVILFVIVLYYLIKNQKSLGLTGIYAGVVFCFLLYYTIIPIFLFIFEDNYLLHGGYERAEYYVFSREKIDHVYSLIVILLGFFSFHFGYKLSRIVKLRKYNRSKKLNEDKEINKKVLFKTFEIVGYITLFLGAVSFTIIIQALGGIGNTLAIGEVIRGFDGDNSLASFIGRNKALLLIPARLITVTPIIFYFLIINRNNPLDKVIFVISFVISMIFLLFNAGKTPLILFLIPFIYIFFKNYFKRVWTKLIILAIIALPLIDVLDNLFIYFSTKQWEKVEVDYLSYIHDFIFPIRNILNLRDIVSIENYQFGINFFKEILDVLPRVSFDPLFYITSEYYGGPNWRSGIPTDILTYGYFQMGSAGVVLTLLLFGFIIGKLEQKLIKLPRGKSRDFISVVLATSVTGVVAYADLSSLLKSNVIFLSICLILIVASRHLTRQKQ